MISAHNLLGLQARVAAARGNTAGASHSGKQALGLNIAAVVLYVVLLTFTLIAGLALGLGLGIGLGNIQCSRTSTNIDCN